MTITLAPDDRPTPRVANLAARTSKGSVLYPPEFWNHANHDTVRNPGDAHPKCDRRDSAREPESPVSRMDRWYKRNEGFFAVVLGLVGTAAVLGTLYRIVLGPIPGIGR